MAQGAGQTRAGAPPAGKPAASRGGQLWQPELESAASTAASSSARSSRKIRHGRCAHAHQITFFKPCGTCTLWARWRPGGRSRAEIRARSRQSCSTPGRPGESAPRQRQQLRGLPRPLGPRKGRDLAREQGPSSTPAATRAPRSRCQARSADHAPPPPLDHETPSGPKQQKETVRPQGPSPRPRAGRLRRAAPARRHVGQMCRSATSRAEAGEPRVTAPGTAAQVRHHRPSKRFPDVATARRRAGLLPEAASGASAPTPTQAKHPRMGLARASRSRSQRSPEHLSRPSTCTARPAPRARSPALENCP
jgi:hypothetical protein